MTIIWPGEVGSSYTNTSEKIVYQFRVSGVNTCGLCYSYHLAVAKWWGKMHHGCMCSSVPLYPGQSSAPYEDWRKLIDDLDPEQRSKVVGKANMALIDAGLVKWSDVVTTNRVRLLREVVSRENLTVDQMVRAGVKPVTARIAHSTVNTPAHVLAHQQKLDLTKQILDLGIKPQHLKEMFGEKMAARVGIKWGPFGASKMPPGKSDADWVRILQRSLRPIVPVALGVLAPSTVAKPPLLPPATEAAQTNIDRAVRLADEDDVETRVLTPAEAAKVWGEKANQVAASYDFKRDRILINGAFPGWDDPVAKLKAAANLGPNGWFSSDDPDHWINHEVAHAKHARAIGKDAFAAMKSEKPEGRATILREVSAYGSTLKVEFVAEVGAGLKAGKTYSQGVMDYYAKLGGVLPGTAKLAPTVATGTSAKANLVHASASEKAKPIRSDMAEARREGKGKDARLVMADGSKAPEHVKVGMVPPAWTDVKVSIDPNAEVLVTGRDQKGRPKMVTSKSYDARSAAVKFSRVGEMVDQHDTIAKEIQQARKDPARKEEADCAWLMQVQGTRPGSDADTKAKVKAYGATTLEARHVVKTDEGVRLQFIGKEGIYHDHLIRDPRLAEMLMERKNAAASESDRIFKTSDTRVRDFTTQQDGGKFTPKDFRTSAATRMAMDEVKNTEPPKTAKEYKAKVMEVATKVSRLLGNRPAQALESYIHPVVFAPWNVK